MRSYRFVAEIIFQLLPLVLICHSRWNNWITDFLKYVYALSVIINSRFPLNYLTFFRPVFHFYISRKLWNIFFRYSFRNIENQKKWSHSLKIFHVGYREFTLKVYLYTYKDVLLIFTKSLPKGRFLNAKGIFKQSWTLRFFAKRLNFHKLFSESL